MIVTPTPSIDWNRFTTRQWLEHRDQDVTKASMLAARTRLETLGFTPFWCGNDRYWKRG